MAITVTPTFVESPDGDVISDFSVNHHHELYRGSAPDYLHIDDATGDYFLEEQPTFRSEEEQWSYRSDDFSSHPILGEDGTDQEAALYWLDHSTPVTEAELSAMLDALEGYDGPERFNRELLIAFKCGDVDFTELPLELQQDLIEASGYEPAIDDAEVELDEESFALYQDIHQADPDSSLVSVFDDLAADAADEGISTIAALSARFHDGEDADALIEQAVDALGFDGAIDAYYRLNELLTNYDF